MTSAFLCTEDHTGTALTSASASRITSGGTSMTISDDACTATAIKLAIAIRYRPNKGELRHVVLIGAAREQIAQPLHRGIEDIVRSPLDDEAGYGSTRLDSDVESHSGLVDSFGFQGVFDMLAMLLGGPLGVVDNPVGAPVIFQNLFADEAQDLDDCLHMV